MPQKHNPRNGQFVGTSTKSIGGAKAQVMSTGQAPKGVRLAGDKSGKVYPAGTTFHKIDGKIHAISPSNNVPTPGRGGNRR